MNLLCIYFDDKIQLAPIIGALIAAIIVIVGWFIIARLNRKNEIAKELRGYRIDMLKTVLEFRQYFAKLLSISIQNKQTPDLKDSKLSELCENAFNKIQMFGKNDERNLMEELSKEADNNQFSAKLQKLTVLCANRLREELKLEKQDEN